MNAISRRGLLGLRLTLAAIYAVLWIGGTGGHLLYGGTPPEMGWTAPIFLTTGSVLLLLSALDDWRALCTGLGVGLLFEFAGANTGYPFGTYAYTGALGWTWWGVPLVVGGAWMIITGWVRQLRLPVWVGALTMTACDLVIDPASVNTLHYWTWRDGGPYYGVPLLNFAGWFLASAVILGIAKRRPARRNWVELALGSAGLLFFALVSAAHALRVPTLVGLTLCGAGYLRWRSSSVSTRIWETARLRNHF